jgi:hypothetical protein
MSLLLKEQIQISTKTNPEISELKTKIFTLKQFGKLSEIDTLRKLQEYVQKCLEIQRPEESPRVFVCSSESDFNYLLTQIQTWEVAKNNLILPKIQTIKPGNEALRDTFFYDEVLGYFNPSDYFVLINPNPEIIQQIEAKASQVSDQTVVFDKQVKADELPKASDPFDLETVDPTSKTQVLVGDKIIYPYQSENGEIVIKLAKLNY